MRYIVKRIEGPSLFMQVRKAAHDRRNEVDPAVQHRVVLWCPSSDARVPVPTRTAPRDETRHIRFWLDAR